MWRKLASVCASVALGATLVTVAPPGIVSAAPITSDDFTSGNFAAWTSNTRLTIDTTTGSPAAPSARASVTAQSAFAVRTLPSPVSQLCVSVNVNLASGSSVDLFRLRTAGNGGIIKAFIAGNGTVQMRNDLNPATRTTTVALGTGWHNVELCGTVGAASTWTLYRDGILINTWPGINTGTTPVGIIQLGHTSSQTFTANFDHFVVDQAPGDETVTPPSGTTEDFTSGNFSGFTSSTRLTIDNTTGNPAAPSARASVTSQTAFAVRTLPTPLSQLCVSVVVNLASGNSIDLFRLRTAANAGIIKASIAANGTVQMRNDLNPETRTTTTPLGTGWHTVELCGSTSGTSVWTLYHDRILINTWTTNTGTTPVGIVQLGMATSGTFTANFDHFVIDQAPSDPGAPADNAAPTVPGTPTGTSTTTSSITLNWAPSTDPSTPITYRVYRDGGATQVGTSNSTTFTDNGLAAGSNHTYTVAAVDSAGNVSARSASSPTITVLATLVGALDDFDSGNFSSWTSNTRLTIDNTTGSASPPSARANPVAQTAFAVRTLPTALSQLCVSVNVNLTAGSAIDLFRLRTAANGAIIKASIAANGTVQMRNDLNPATRTTTRQLGTGWHNVELCGTVGATSTWTLYHDGELINTWAGTNTGTTPVRIIQLGMATPATFTANYDHFVVDQAPSDPGAPADTNPPTVPGAPTGSSTSTSTITLNWTGSTDPSTPITYRIYRDGGTSQVGSTTNTTFTDTGLTPGSNHTYTVAAVDSAGNVSARSASSPTITVLTTLIGASDDFTTGNFSGWTSDTGLTIDTTDGSPAAPSARANVVSQAAFAVRTLPVALSQLCVSVNVNLSSGSGVDLFRLRTAASGPVIKASVTATGNLSMRNDFSPATRATTTPLGTGWHNVELCGTVGAASEWTLYRDGALINTWSGIDTGTAAVGIIQLGDVANKTFTANYDHFVVDQAVG